MDDFIKDLIEVRKSNLGYKLYKNVLHPVPEWNVFLEYIEKTKIDGNYRSDRPGFYVLHANKQSDFYIFKSFDIFQKALFEIYPEIISESGATAVISETYRNIAEVSGISKHTDPQDTIHWNCVGATIWKFYEKDSFVEEIVEPGDIIFVRSGTEHEVESLTPRAGIVYSAGRGESVY